MWTGKPPKLLVFIQRVQKSRSPETSKKLTFVIFNCINHCICTENCRKKFGGTKFQQLLFCHLLLVTVYKRSASLGSESNIGDEKFRTFCKRSLKLSFTELSLRRTL